MLDAAAVDGAVVGGRVDLQFVVPDVSGRDAGLRGDFFPEEIRIRREGPVEIENADQDFRSVLF